MHTSVHYPGSTALWYVWVGSFTRAYICTLSRQYSTVVCIGGLLHSCIHRCIVPPVQYCVTDWWDPIDVHTSVHCPASTTLWYVLVGSYTRAYIFTLSRQHSTVVCIGGLLQTCIHLNIVPPAQHCCMYRWALTPVHSSAHCPASVEHCGMYWWAPTAVHTVPPVQHCGMFWWAPTDVHTSVHCPVSTTLWNVLVGSYTRAYICTLSRQYSTVVCSGGLLHQCIHLYIIPPVQHCGMYWWAPTPVHTSVH